MCYVYAVASGFLWVCVCLVEACQKLTPVVYWSVDSWSSSTACLVKKQYKEGMIQDALGKHAVVVVTPQKRLKCIIQGSL